jgi:crotonobetainyl-CoA:carnitine CoA-transferase CaiB-like acyl-CoA transferase
MFMQNEVLAGRRVLELGTMLAAPFAAHLLGQLGAEVIKIEPPAGDTTRKLVRGGPGGTFIAYSRGKKGICIDLTTPGGYEAFEKLLATADVVIHNLSPQAARKLRVTYEDCARIKSNLIYCHIRGYGAGPLENELASNPVAEAATGVMYAHRIEGRPSRLGPSYHDQFAGAYAVIGILAAICASSDGRGRNLSFGLYETGLHVAARDLVAMQLKTQLTGKTEQQPSGEFSMPGYGAYETLDGRWIYLVMLTDAHWKKFWEALSQTDKSHDESLATLRQRKKRRDQVEAWVGAAVKAQVFEDIARRLTASGFGYAEVLPPDRVLDNPQARQPGKIGEFYFQGYEFEVPEFPLRFDAAADRPESPPPLLGEHTAQILNELGYDDVTYAALVEQGAVAAADASGHGWAPVRQKE